MVTFDPGPLTVSWPYGSCVGSMTDFTLTVYRTLLYEACSWTFRLDLDLWPECWPLILTLGRFPDLMNIHRAYTKQYRTNHTRFVLKSLWSCHIGPALGLLVLILTFDLNDDLWPWPLQGSPLSHIAYVGATEYSVLKSLGPFHIYGLFPGFWSWPWPLTLILTFDPDPWKVPQPYKDNKKMVIDNLKSCVGPENASTFSLRARFRAFGLDLDLWPLILHLTLTLRRLPSLRVHTQVNVSPQQDCFYHFPRSSYTSQSYVVKLTFDLDLDPDLWFWS